MRLNLHNIELDGEIGGVEVKEHPSQVHLDSVI